MPDETTSPNALTALKNIGATTARRLLAVGVDSEDALRAMGPAETYRRIRASRPGETTPRCYYLYALEGALRGLHWNDIGEARKREHAAAVDDRFGGAS